MTKNFDRAKFNRGYLRKKLSIISVLNYLGLSVSLNKNFSCPFHSDRLASARCYSDKNAVKCFACNQWWDPVEFYSAYKKISNSEAENILLKKYGLSKEAITDDAFGDAVSDILSTKKLDLSKYRSKIDKQITEFYRYPWKHIRNYALGVLDYAPETLYNDATKEEIDKHFKDVQRLFMSLKILDENIEKEIASGQI